MSAIQAEHRMSNLEAAAMEELSGGGGALPAKVLIDQIEQIHSEEGLEYTRIAGAIGISHSTLSPFRKGKYRADDRRIREKITQWLTTRRMQSSFPMAEYVETTIARQIHWVCSQAMANGTMGLVIGPSGIGKDMALYEYQRRLPGRVAIVECDGVSGGRFGMLRETAEALELKGSVDPHGGYNSADIRDAIIRKLSASRAGGGRGFLVIWNECHLLDYAALEMGRRLLDKAGTGGVLVGTARLATQLTGRGKLLYEQIARRCQAVRSFRQIDEVAIEDVRAVAESVAAQPISKTVLGLLLEECNSQEPGHLGKLGRVAMLVRQAVQLSEGGDLSVGNIDDAIKLLAA